MFPLAFVAGWLQGHWWGFISRNYVVWPTFFLMNVFIALKGSHFWFYIRLITLFRKGKIYLIPFPSLKGDNLRIRDQLQLRGDNFSCLLENSFIAPERIYFPKFFGYSVMLPQKDRVQHCEGRGHICTKFTCRKKKKTYWLAIRCSVKISDESKTREKKKMNFLTKLANFKHIK